jgi:hypothetical protein
MRPKTKQRFIALFDVHIGRNYKYIRGERVIRPTHNLKALRAVMDFVEKEWRPDVFILGGDQLNFGPISHWHRGKPRVDENMRLQWEYDLLGNEILDRVRKIPRKIWLDGNHEMWIQQFLDSEPGLEGLIEPQSYLDLGRWEHLSQGEIYKLGKLHFIHGDTVRPGKNVASRAVAMYRRNLRMGHHHRFDAETDVTPIDRKDFHSCIVVPAMSARGMAYMKNAPENYMQGFLLGEVYPNGDFQDHVMIINKSRFYWNGKKFGR